MKISHTKFTRYCHTFPPGEGGSRVASHCSASHTQDASSHKPVWSALRSCYSRHLRGIWSLKNMTNVFNCVYNDDFEQDYSNSSAIVIDTEVLNHGINISSVYNGKYKKQLNVFFSPELMKVIGLYFFMTAVT